MTVLNFPPVAEADENGLLAIGGDLDIDTLLLAYKSGIFPWPINDEFLTWFAPPKRAVLFFEDFHISKSLSKEINKNKFEIKINTNFEKVIYECAKTKFRKKQDGTWITEEMIAAYINLHNAGYAYSVEAYYMNELVGGHYGVSIGGMCAGESMFYKMSNASKVSLVYIVEYLKSKGLNWLDCQVMTPHLKSFGAREIKRDKFMDLLISAIAKKSPFDSGN